MTLATLQGQAILPENAPSGWDWVQSASPQGRNVDEFDFLDPPVATLSSGIERAKPVPYVIVYSPMPFGRGLIPPSSRFPEDYFGNLGVTAFAPRDAARENWLAVSLETARVPGRDAEGKTRLETWRRIALEQLEDLDAKADEEELERPSAEARTYAERFIHEFAKTDLPPASVFPDDDRGVSIQMEVTGFIFLLTCFEGGNGIYNAVHDTYRVTGSYKDLSIADIAESEFLQLTRCLMRPLTEHASLADRTE